MMSPLFNAESVQPICSSVLQALANEQRNRSLGNDAEVRRVETLSAQVVKQPLIGWISTEGNLIKLIQVYEKLRWPVDCLLT